MRTLIGTLPDMIYAKDTEGRFIMGNIGVARHMGAATPEDLVGKTDFDFYPREFAEQYYADEQAIIRLGQPIINREEPSVDAAGNPKWDLTTKVLWQDNQGKTIGLVGVSRDITERKQADAKLQETLQELERLYRATAREGWQAFRETGQIAAGYLFDRAELRPAEDIWLPQIEQAIRQNTLVPPAPSPVTTEAGRDGSVAVAPLSVRGEVIGAVGVYDDPQQPLSPEDLVLVQEIAEQGALALESARLFEQTQASLTEARVLYEASRRVSSAPSLQDMVVAVAEGIRVPVINRAVLWDLEYDTTGRPEAFTAVANWHSGQGTPPLPVGTRLPLSQFPATCLILNAEPVFMEDAECDERLDPITRAVFQPQQARAMAILPLWSSERQLGALMLVADQPHRFTDNEIRPYTSLARQMAVAIENRRLFEQTRAALEEVEATHRRYLREQWETYLREATEKAFGFVDGPAGVKAADEVWLPEMEQALEIGEPVIVAASEDQAQRGALAVPIKLRGAPIGVLEFYDENAQRTWSDNERALVETLADQAALALENARLFEDTQARAQREQLINTITARIRASTEMEAILKTTAEELSRVLNLSRARIRLHAGDGKGDPSND
jgi:PAS domain S-box-containing protein